MLKNYFKTALRNLWRNRTTGFINLFGLSIGMTAAVFVFLWVQNETSVNAYQPDKENIYRITSTIPVNSGSWIWESSPMLMAEAAKRDLPEIKQSARIMIDSWVPPVIKLQQQLFSEKGVAHVDKSWFDLFHYDFVQGNATAFGSSPFSVVMTESKAKQYFGNKPAIGQVIMIDTLNYTVEGVVKDIPVNSSFQSDVLLNLEGRLSNPKTYENDKTWNNFSYITFLQLRPGTAKAGIEKKLNELINSHRKENSAIVSIVPLSDIYFETGLQSSEMPHGNKKTTYIFTILGFLLLLTACINYVNLTTAKAGLRVKEVSVRKIVGARRSSLFAQFIAESFIISLLAIGIALLLIQLLLPAFNSITEKQFRLPLTSIALWQVLGGTLAIATVLNGIYPALLLSSFRPLNVFRGASVLRLRDGSVRKGLVVFQFALSMLLITGAIVIYRQLHFIQHTNPGYNVSQVASLQLSYRDVAAMDGQKAQSFLASLRQELASQSSIAAVSTANARIVNIQSYSSGNADWDGRDTSYNPTIAQVSADAAFQKMFALQMQAGRWFQDDFTDRKNYILNETAVKELNIPRPVIGQRFTWGGDTGQVIGVVKDFYFKSLHEKIGPLVVRNDNRNWFDIFLKIAPGHIDKALADAQRIWAKYLPNRPFEYTFLDDSFNILYKTDIKTAQLIFIFCVVAVIISALGLFGLAAFTAERRVKEIGIRKVLGASVTNIINLISIDFIRLVLVAILLAIPVAWYAMNKWLQDFAYRIDLSAWIFITAGVLAILIAMLSVSVQAIKAAIANPVKSLRTE